jgi:two-component system phosphate regulon response regulator PhoB
MLNGDSNKASSSDPPLVLIAAADDSFASFVEYIFRNMGLYTLTASNSQALMQCLEDHMPDALVLESSLPDVDVRVLCTRLRMDRRTRTMAIIVLAADGDDGHQREVLESGADQYLGKPFSPEQLMTSVRSVLEEANRAPKLGSGELLTFLDLELDLARYRVQRGGRVIHLAPTEFRLLHHFMKNPRRVYSRDELQHAAWPRAVNLGPRTIDVHIGRLRAALNEAGERDLIRTVRSVGYALSD